MKKVIYFLTLLAISIWLFAKPFRLSGDCMEPAANDGKLYFLNRILPYFRPYQIGDIILFNHEEKTWVSRIVALENNTVHISEGKVTVNGKVLQDAKIHRNWLNWKLGTFGIDKPFQVPQNHVYVLSDNLAAQHDDSRVFGPISKGSILGLIW